MKRKPSFTLPWRYSGLVLAALIALFLMGCAGGSAKPVSSIKADEPLPRPPVFLIYDFAVDPEDVIVDTTGLTSGDEASTAERLSEGKE